MVWFPNLLRYVLHYKSLLHSTSFPPPQQMASLVDQMWEGLGKKQQADFERKYQCCGSKPTLDSFSDGDLCGGDPFDTFKSAMGIQKGQT